MAWRNVFSNSLSILSLGLLLIGVLYNSTIPEFYVEWSEENSAFSHAYLFFPLCLWIVYREWIRLSPKQNYSWWPVLLIAGISFSWFAAKTISVLFVEQFSLILLCALIVPAILGSKNGIRLMLPFLFLFTTAPSFAQLSGELQELTAILSGWLLNLVGVSTYQDGYLLMIAEGEFKVSEGCSGLRYEIAAISIALLDGYISRMTWAYFVSYVLLLSGVAFFANAIRILAIVVAAHMTNMQTSLIDDHIWLGWIIFAVLMPLTMWLWHKYIPYTVLPLVTNSEARGNIPLKSVDKPKGMKAYSVMAGLLGSLLLGPVLFQIYSDGQAVMRKMPSTPELTGMKWQFVGSSAGDWHTELMPPSNEVKGRYTDTNLVSVDLHLAYYAKQLSDSEAINMLNKLYASNEWTEISRQSGVDSGIPGLSVEQIQIRNRSGMDRLVWRWYYLDGQHEGNPIIAKLMNFIATLKGSTGVAVFIISTDVPQDIYKAVENLKQFIRGNNRAMEEWTSAISRFYQNE